MGVIYPHTFSSLLNGLSHADSPTDSLQYRSEIIRRISSGTSNDELAALAYDEYLRDHSLEVECIRSFGVQTKLMLPASMSRSVSAALLADSQLLPLVNCSHLACNVPCSHDDCYNSTQWRDVHAEDTEEWFQKCHRFSNRPLHIQIGRNLALNALQQNDYTLVSDSLCRKHIGDAFDNGFVSACAGLASQHPTESHYLPQPKLIDVTDRDFVDRHFWQSLAPLRSATISNSSVWVMNGLTAIDLMALEDEKGDRIVKSNTHENTSELLGHSIIQPRACCLRSFGHVRSGDVFAMLVDPVGFTMNLLPGLPLFPLQEEPALHGSANLDVILPCDGVVTDTRGWLLLRKK